MSSAKSNHNIGVLIKDNIHQFFASGRFDIVNCQSDIHIIVTIGAFSPRTH